MLKVCRHEGQPMTIYTGRGDDGETDLRDRSRVSKASPRIDAYGTVDELNAVIGTVIPTGHGDIDERLEQVQHHLHIIQAQLADPVGNPEQPHIEATHVDDLEVWIDEAESELTPLHAFILPGGGERGSRLHHARTVCRRAERATVALIETVDDEHDSDALVYLNRLSDLLFDYARLVNQREGFEERNPTY